MKVVHVAYECAPIYKVGGLGDVVGSLPKAQAQIGVETAVIMPGYGWIKRLPKLPYSKVWVWYVESHHFLRRDPTYNPRQQIMTFGHFCWLALEVLKKKNFQPDIIHCHDWHAALIPLLLSKNPDPFFANTKCVLTIHNISYQGNFPIEYLEKPETSGILKLMPLSAKRISFIEQGINHADYVTTVSPTYAQEVVQTKFGFGLQKILRARVATFTGVINGIDYHTWNPATDRFIYKQYTIHTRKSGKQASKLQLQKHFKLVPSAEIPLYGFVARLVSQKGIDVVAKCLNEFRDKNIQLIILGSGDKKTENKLLEYYKHERDHWLSLNFSFREDWAHKIYAGCDFFLIPSHFEPCGLTQMISMRYGTIPIASAVGGLKDTITEGKTGFLFHPVTAPALRRAVKRSLALWKNPRQMAQFRMRVMQQNFSWKKSARAYFKIYKSLLLPK